MLQAIIQALVTGTGAAKAQNNTNIFFEELSSFLLTKILRQANYNEQEIKLICCGDKKTEKIIDDRGEKDNIYFYPDAVRFTSIVSDNFNTFVRYKICEILGKEKNYTCEFVHVVSNEKIKQDVLKVIKEEPMPILESVIIDENRVNNLQFVAYIIKYKKNKEE
ncbi:MAG: hypothetical protein PHG18_01905 [Bacilli bacterium]|nr:hypothetical protein [Bacilli bacterium]